MPQAVVQGTKRDRGLSHRGQHSLVLERAVPLQQEGNKTCSQAFHMHTVEVFGGFHILRPPSLPPSLCPYLHGPCPMNSRTAASPEGGSPCYPRLSLSSSLVPHTIARYRKMANSTFHIISGELLSTSCPALVLLVFRGRKTGGCSIVLLVFSSQVI